jgi:glutathione S-transferase
MTLFIRSTLVLLTATLLCQGLRTPKFGTKLVRSLSMAASTPTWDEIKSKSLSSEQGAFMSTQEALREKGEGLAHTDAKMRLFGTDKERVRVTYFRDAAAWCPYCQKVWILLEEKKIPYMVEKINMRSYGDKPPAFLRMVPNGLLPAMALDGNVQTDSLQIMMNLERTFRGPEHPSMWPDDNSPQLSRAKSLMGLERQLFGAWCDLVFRQSFGGISRNRFEETLDTVNRELGVTSGPWFLDSLSIVDLTYISHVERMCASVAYWSGFVMRGGGRWKNIERWMDAFEALPSYMATKSDYYTHIEDIPPQYGAGNPVRSWREMGGIIDGQGAGSWTLPLPPFKPDDIEPVSPAIDPGEDKARQEAAYKVQKNHANIVKFALRGAGKPGKKSFSAPLADPYAEPNLDYLEEMDLCMRTLTTILLDGSAASGSKVVTEVSTTLGGADKQTKAALVKSLTYFRDRIGVPRDMGYPAARQLRAHINWMITTQL